MNGRQHRFFAALWFGVAQLCALITGLFQISFPHRSAGMFLLAFVGSTFLPATWAMWHWTKARSIMSETKIKSATR